jgi:hypothetical protein
LGKSTVNRTKLDPVDIHLNKRGILVVVELFGTNIRIPLVPSVTNEYSILLPMNILYTVHYGEIIVN